MEKTFIFIKPDAIETGKIGKIFTAIEGAGFSIEALRVKRITDQQYNEHYGHIKHMEFYEDMRKYITSRPVVMAVITGENVIAGMRKLIGATRGAAPGTIRGDLGSDGFRNLIHASDCDEAVHKEIRLFNIYELEEYEIYEG